MWIVLYHLVKYSSCQSRIVGDLGPLSPDSVLCKVCKVGYFVLTPCTVNPVVPLAGEIVEILVEFGALCGVYLRAVLLDIAYGQSVEADRLSFLFFKVSREVFRFPACQIVVDLEFIRAVRAHDSLGAIAIDIFA